MPAGRDVEGGNGQVPWRIVRDRAETIARIVVSAESVEVEPDARGHDLTRIRVRIENLMPMREGASRRDDALRQALVGTHTLLAVCGGSFLSLTDPPSGLESAAAACSNIHCWPVLVGDPQRQDILLSSPIVLYDFPSIAPESPESLFDGTEIDELLTLRILTLTDEEKAQARATDDRARHVIDRVESLSDDQRGKLHGVMHPVEQSVPEDHAWRTLLNPPGEASPESASIEIGGVSILKGSRVRLRPVRRADPIDTFMAGRLARVEGIFHDVDGRTHVAVVVDDDPAGDLHAEFGRFLYYGPEEIEPARPADEERM